MKYLWLLILASSSTANFSQKSSFNGKILTTDSTGNYSFIVSGHFHGSSSNQSHFPANTLLANLEKINDLKSTMLICLGDLFMDIRNDTANYKWSLFDKLDMPLYNAVGNHDLGGTSYSERYGKTWFSFVVSNDLHVILDTESDNGQILGEQLTFFKAQCELAKMNGYANIFFYAHRTIWTETYPEMEGLFEDNTQSILSSNFESDLLPLCTEVSKSSKVWWFAGSLGSAPASFFYHTDPENSITYIATAIRELPRDAILKINVVNDEVSFKTISLTGENLLTLPEYNIDFWKSNSADTAFNWKLTPLYFQQAFTHRYFWYGTAFALAIVLLFRWMKRRRSLRSKS